MLRRPRHETKLINNANYHHPQATHDARRFAMGLRPEFLFPRVLMSGGQLDGGAAGAEPDAEYGVVLQ